MIYSVILQTAVKLLVPLMLLFSLFLLERGHSEPGGGFVGGLTAASAFALYALSRGTEEARRALWISPRTLVGAGLACALGSGLLAPLRGEPFLKSLWTEVPLPGGSTFFLGSTLLFDTGVYLVVMGITLLIVLALEEHDVHLTEGI